MKNKYNSLIEYKNLLEEYNKFSEVNNKKGKNELEKEMNNYNLVNNQNYIINNNKIKNISKKLSKLFYYGFIEEGKKLSSFGIIKKVEVPFFTIFVLFFLVFLFFLILLGYLLISEFTVGILLAFLFILFWGFLVFIIPFLSKKMKVKVLLDKDRYLYYFYNKKNEK